MHVTSPHSSFPGAEDDGRAMREAASSGNDTHVWRHIRDVVVGAASKAPAALDASVSIDWDALLAMENAGGGAATSATAGREATALDSPRYHTLNHVIAHASSSPTKVRHTPPEVASRVWTRGTAVRTRQVENTPSKDAEPASPSVTSSDNKQVSAAVVTKPPRKKRVRRADEIARLRTEAEALEAKLLDLREYWKQQSSSATLTASYAKSRHGEYGLRWRSMAAHEEEMLREAEQTNDELRAEYHWQKKMARDLRKILMKRVAIATKFDYVFYNMRQPDAGQLLANSAFDRLVHDLAPMSDALERIQGILEKWELRHGTHTFREWNVRDDDREAHASLFLELVDSYALPFDFALVNDAVRRQFGEDNKNRPDKSFSEYLNHAGDITVHQSIVRYNNSQGIGNVRLREVVRNIDVSATHAVFLSMKLIEPSTDAGEPVHAMIIREKTWTVIRGSSSRDSNEGDMTFVQSYHTMVPEVVYEGFEGEWTRKKIEGELIPAWNMSLGTVHRRLESDLLEHSMRSSLRSLPPSTNV